MGKVSSFYSNQRIFFATKHKKEEILSPLFLEIGANCSAITIDTDQFGTFTGERERTGSIRATLRMKIEAAAKVEKSGRFFLASEGSFGPDPLIGFIQTDLESLLLWDRETNHEIYAEFLCRNPIHSEIKLGPRDDLEGFLRQIQFPDHSVIARPIGKDSVIYKGLNNRHDLHQALLNCFSLSTEGKVKIETDLRAHHNRTRRAAIRSAGEVLIEKMQSLCPHCSFPGFAISRAVPGLRCEACDQPSRVVRAVLLECSHCGSHQEMPRPDGLQFLSFDECESCNP